jgi:hypothetical protein
MKPIVTAVVVALACAVPGRPAHAEQATYGAVELTGLASRDWHLNPPGPDNTMVCNLKSAKAALPVRAGPGDQHPVRRSFHRLAILVVDTRNREGPWIRVTSAHRTHTPQGKRIKFKPLPVKGWADSRFLCGFLD